MRVFDVLTLSASVLLSASPVGAQKASTPCQSLSSMSAAFTSMFPKATQALVPAQVAADCLKSVPIDKNEDLALIKEMLLYVNWQSSLAYIDNPPKGDTSGRVPTLSSIAKITSDLQNDKYKDEFTLQMDLAQVFTRSYDFHFNWIPDITQLFMFLRGNVGRGLLDEFAVVSVSADGQALPKLYNYYDIIVSAQEGWTASPLSEINNQSAETYIQNWSLNQPYHEDHARYNKLFPSQPEISTGTVRNEFGSGFTPDGDYTYVKHENGSTFKYINTSPIPLKALDGIVDGRALFKRFCNQGPPQSSSTSSKRSVTGVEPRDSAKPSPTGYPAPVVYHSEGVVGGYYITGQGYSDVAVLSLTSFSPTTDDSVVEFQNDVGQFLNKAVQDGKKKLVVDLRDNGGGRVDLGYDVFKQLFPSMDPYGATQFRANDAFGITGQLMDQYFKDHDITFAKALADLRQKGQNSSLAATWQSIFNWRLPLTAQNKNFTSWTQYFGPNARYNDKWTTLARGDLNNPFTDDLSINVTGFGSRANNLNRKQPFDSANIIMLHDGGCGSTCSIFTEFMKTQGNVQSIVVGGLPKTGPMQANCGSKGAQVYTFDTVNNEASTAYNLMPNQQGKLNKTELGALVFAQRPLMRTAYSDEGAMSRINLRDNIRMNDTTFTPLDFVYEAADCRLFYTADMVRDVTNVWKKTVDVQWGSSGKKLCVSGSTGDPSSLSGGAKPQLGNPSTKGSSPGNSKSDSTLDRTNPSNSNSNTSDAGRTMGSAWMVMVVAAVLVQSLL